MVIITHCHAVLVPTALSAAVALVSARSSGLGLLCGCCECRWLGCHRRQQCAQSGVTDPYAYSVYSLIAPTIQCPPGFVVVRNEKSHRRLGDKLYGTVKALIRRQLANCIII